MTRKIDAALERAVTVVYEQHLHLKNMNASTSTTQTTTNTTTNDDIFDRIVFVQPYNSTSQQMIPFGYYTSCKTNIETNDTNRTASEEQQSSSIIVVQQIIQYQYMLTMNSTYNTTTAITTKNTTTSNVTMSEATKSNVAKQSSLSSSSSISNDVVLTIEKSLQDYLTAELLRLTCSNRQSQQDLRNSTTGTVTTIRSTLQFQSLSSLPIDATETSINDQLSCTTSSCTIRMNGGITVEYYYGTNENNNRRRNNIVGHVFQQQPPRTLTATTFSDTVLLERMGTLLSNYYSQMEILIPSNDFDGNRNSSSMLFATFKFLSISNFVPDDQPTFDTHPSTTSNQNNSTIDGINTSIDQKSNNSSSIDKSTGIIILTIAITMFIITLLMIVFRHRRRRRRTNNIEKVIPTKSKRSTTPTNNIVTSRQQQQQKHILPVIEQQSIPPMTSVQDTRVRSKDGVIDVYIVNDIDTTYDEEDDLEGDDDIYNTASSMKYNNKDVSTKTTKSSMKYQKDWQIYNTNNDTPPIFIPSFDDEDDTYMNESGIEARWI